MYVPGISPSGAGSVWVINSHANKVIATIPLSAQASAVAVSPRSSKVYVVNGGSVSVINGLTNHVIANIPGFGNPGGIAVSPKTGTVYVANSGGGTVSVISPSTPAQLILAPFQTPQPKSSQTQQVAPVANADCIL